jgi:hypothetical protein
LALKLPQSYNPRTLELVANWRAETADDAEFARRVLAWFNQEEFRYTLNPPLLSRHSVDEFLFDTRAGFCEHYASAFTFMMRAAGIPARVVTGYLGGWMNGLGNYLLVRQSDAHAWSEIWLEGRGWTRIDPTAAVAPSRVESNSLDALGARRHMFDFAWVRSLRNGFDLLERGWNDWIITFDAVRQSGLLGRFGIESLGARGLVMILSGVVGLMSLVLLVLLLRRHLGGGDRAGRLWAAFRAQLASAGVPGTSAMGPLELSARASRLWPQNSAAIREFTAAYLHLRYADQAQDDQELRQAWQRLRRHRKDPQAA